MDQEELNNEEECVHEYRIVDDFYIEVDRTKRVYAAYCCFCLKVTSLIIDITEKKQ